MKNKKTILDEREHLWLLINSKPNKTFQLKGTYDYAAAISPNNQYIAIQIQNEDEERELLIYNTVMKRNIKIQKSNYIQLIFSPNSMILVGSICNKWIQVMKLKSTAKKFKVDKQSQLINPKHFPSNYNMEFKTDKNYLFVFSVENGQFAIWNLESDDLIAVVNYYIKQPMMVMKLSQEDSNILGIIKKMRIQYRTTSKDFKKLIFNNNLLSVEYLQEEGGMMIKCRNKILRSHFDSKFGDEIKSLSISTLGTRIIYVSGLVMYLYSVATGNILLKKKIYNVEKLILNDHSLIMIEGELIKYWDTEQT
ncbi:unnamed protein product (macronuclear) [Paramecium tetraurelia]|uniref:Uncharacterized protein n=1 Tax=Paramecium tetraurelia TaxID=5888 RepID=A0E8M4_PARTE|nr:uncharacterized protein GSPATT00024370001 [Paramecium tetraurelia]CAK91641.1 unnamed protein product [Paramecium tetraurelia]|eukprot:XP_001459038.1 hypothetical protein (macronuclear) [Paramecium tetraurelia strain d4-2]